MLEPEQGQRCRVEYSEDQAQHTLTDHKAADGVVDLAGKSPDGRAVRRRGIQLSITATIFFQS